MSTIPYELINDVPHVLLGRKRVSGKLTDIGGGCKIKVELPVKCLAREIMEETGQTFQTKPKTKFVLLPQGKDITSSRSIPVS
jgi:8-oxo-dGTP pyrophosphatase MutT (NUDIX family)